MMSEDDITLKGIDEKLDRLIRLITGHWKDEAARRRERGY